jgi:hypothetical protein
MVSVVKQVPEPTVYVNICNPFNPAGLNVVPLTPEPLHAPPVGVGFKDDRFTGGAVTHIPKPVPAFVTEGLITETTILS